MGRWYFSEPQWLWLLLLLVPIVVAHLRRKSALRLPSVAPLKPLVKRRWQVFSRVPLLLRCLVVAALVVAMARPQSGDSRDRSRTEGLDIMLVVDTSASMKALDFQMDGKRRNRLYVVKKVLGAFIAQRTDDRLGLVVFGSEAYAQAPLTLDHDVLQQYLDATEIGMAGDATAIGDAIAVATNRLKDLKAKSKVVVLLTDGSNTAGKIDPGEAAKAAHAMGVKVYTIGVGSEGLVPVPTEFGIQHVRMDLDEKLLKDIAQTTGARYFLAKDTAALIDVYATIDGLEKSMVEVDVFRHVTEHYQWWLWVALGLMVVELMLGMTRVRRIP